MPVAFEFAVSLCDLVFLETSAVLPAFPVTHRCCVLGTSVLTVHSLDITRLEVRASGCGSPRQHSSSSSCFWDVESMPSTPVLRSVFSLRLSCYYFLVLLIRVESVRLSHCIRTLRRHCRTRTTLRTACRRAFSARTRRVAARRRANPRKASAAVSAVSRKETSVTRRRRAIRDWNCAALGCSARPSCTTTSRRKCPHVR